MAITDAFKEAIWLQGLLREINLLQGKVKVFSDSQNAIHLCKNPIFHERTKHVNVKYHFVRNQVSDETIVILKIPTKDNPADIGIKIVTTAKFKHCLGLLHVEVG